MIGYAEVGECFEAAAPFARISLLEVAQQAGDGFELAFFAGLAGRLREVMLLGGSYCEMHGLEPCVRMLRRKRGWGRKCAALRAEIVEFARNSTSASYFEKGEDKPRDVFLYVA